jgi:predicted Zn-dependent protease
VGAIDLLQPWLSDHPRDARAWQLLAVAARAQGQGLRALRAEGESRVAVLDYAGALDRFRAGQALAAQGLRTPAEQIEAAIIDSRTRQVQAQLREQLANAKDKP